MADDHELVLIDALRSLVPVNVLPTLAFDKFAERIKVETAPAGHELFHHGDNNIQVTYLLSGEVALRNHHDKFVQTIRGGSERARYPLAHEIPREVTATATTNIAYVQINMHELNEIMSSDYSLDHQIGDIRVRDIRDVDDDDWITSALQSFVFAALPPVNLQLLLSRFKHLPVKQGEVILNQGEIANYYYYIHRGHCEVTRKTTENDNPVVLAELNQGEGFGEDALIAQTKRNATITMLSDGVLMRLSNTDFKELIEKPLLKPLMPTDIEKYVEQGAEILDVRNPSDYELTHLANSRNIPFQNFRESISTLDPKQRYITYSNNGRRSAVAAFLLMQRGIDAYFLNERRRVSDYTVNTDIPDEKPEQSLEELEKLKKACATLQQQLRREHLLRKAAEEESVECQDAAKESLNAAREKIHQLTAEQEKLQAMQLAAVDSEQLNDELSKLKAEKKEIQHQIDLYHQRIKTEADHLDNEVKAIQDLEATRISALKEIEQLHADTTRSKQEAEEAHRQAELKEQRLIAEAAKLADLNESRLREEKNIQELESRKHELEQIVDRRSDIQHELDALLVQLASSREDMNAVHQQIHIETEKLSALKSRQLEQENILKNNALLEQRLEQLNNEASQAQSKTEQAQEKLRQQQVLLKEMEAKTAEYTLLSESQKKMQAELETLTTQLETTRQKIESTSRDSEAHKLESHLSTLQAKEEAAKIKAEAEEVYLKAEQQAIKIKADAEQARLQAQQEIAKAKVKAEQIQLHAEAEAARIKSELASLQKQSQKQ